MHLPGGGWAGEGARQRAHDTSMLGRHAGFKACMQQGCADRGKKGWLERAERGSMLGCPQTVGKGQVG